jgi:hypothetical protein
MMEGIKQLKAELANSENMPMLSGGWFAKILGVDEDNRAKFLSGFETVKSSLSNSISEMTSAWSSYYDAKINAANQDIQASQERVSQLEAESSKEKELKDKGLANNYSSKEREIQIEKDKQAKLLAEKQKAARAKQNIEKVNLAIDTITQGSNMITASSEIWAWANTVPFAGPAIAATVIAAMWGSFIASKAMMLSELNKTPAFKEGVIDLQGPGTATSDSIPARLSKGESVMTAAETANSKKILTSIREGSLNDHVLGKMLTIDNSILFNNDYLPIAGKLDITNNLLKQMGYSYRVLEDGKRIESTDGMFTLLKR